MLPIKAPGSRALCIRKVDGEGTDLDWACRRCCCCGARSRQPEYVQVVKYNGTCDTCRRRRRRRCRRDRGRHLRQRGLRAGAKPNARIDSTKSGDTFSQLSGFLTEIRTVGTVSRQGSSVTKINFCP